MPRQKDTTMMNGWNANSWNYWATRWMNRLSVHRGQRAGDQPSSECDTTPSAPLEHVRRLPDLARTFPTAPGWLGICPRPPDVAQTLPDPKLVAAVFAASGHGRVSAKSTCLFPAFAQYLTDGFIRTNPTDPRRTTSNHEIDLCPLYGRNAGAD